MQDPVTISLYSGAGGLDFGFEAAGFRTAVAVEMDQRCAQTLRANQIKRLISKEMQLISDDITKLLPSDILGAAQLAAAEADLLIGGPPCQPFSKSGFWATGEARRLNDPRASTLESFLLVLERARPRVFLLENVEGLGFRGKDEGLQYITQRLHQINQTLKTTYRPSIAVLNAADFGVPQQRRRLFIVGARDGTPFVFPKATHINLSDTDGPDDRLPLVTAWEALHDIATPADDDLKLRGKWADLLPSIPEGQNYLWHTQRGGGEDLFGWRRRYWSFLLKLAKNLPSWTIQAQPGPATGPFHWANRRLSVAEMAQLQTFPRGVVITGSHADAQRQIGNAVPSLLAEILAREIGSQLLGRPPAQDAPRLAIQRAAGGPPPPEPVGPVANKYLALRGDHDAHPGTGKGFRASSRKGSALAGQESLDLFLNDGGHGDLAFPNDESLPTEVV
jgi:DNA (cytosine-5)-methyltransferase 1